MTESGVGPKPKPDAMLEFSVALPGVQHVATRAATEQDENRIATLVMLICDPTTGNLIDKLDGTVTSGNGSDLITFKVRIPYSEAPRDLMLVANVDVTNLQPGMSRATIQELLCQEKSDPWVIGGTNRENCIPMYGELTGRVITNAFDPDALANRFSLRRMLARVNVTMESAAQQKFQISKVHFANYNRVGNLMPNPGTDSDTPSIPTGSDIRQQGAFLTYDTTGDLTNTIYVFENEHVAPWPQSEWIDNPCIVIQGVYDENGDGQFTADDGRESFYRLDFVKGDNTWLSVVRNHSYNFNIVRVGGKGYPTREEALRSAPINIAATVVDWDDTEEIAGGKWKGEQYIYYTGVKAHFNQFGNPGPQTLRVTTNVANLTFGNFVDEASGATDDVWQKKPSGEWSNGHFTVAIQSEANNGKYIHTLTVSAKETSRNDNMTVGRKAVFKAVSSLMSLDFQITQDEYIEYNLITTPDPFTAIMVDGAAQRIRIGVESTHTYKVDLDGSMFEGVYTSETGGSVVTDSIPKSTKTIWVAVGENNWIRAGRFIISHSNSHSSARPVIYNMLQATPMISARFRGGKYAMTTDLSGGTYEIDVFSNMARWEPVVTIVDPAYPDNILETYEGAALADWFDVVGGSQSGMVRLTIPAMPVDTETDREYRIRFQSASGGTQTGPGTFSDLTVIQTSGKFELSPNTLENVPASGGVSDWVQVKTYAGFWSIDMVGKGNFQAPDGRRLVKHNETIEVQDFDRSGMPIGNAVEYEEGRSYPTSTRFRVRFPKIYYPNREISVSASLVIKVGNREEVITARQTPLQARALILNESFSGGWTWGSLISGNYVAQAISATLRSAGFTVNVGSENYTVRVPDNTSLLNAVYNRDRVWDQTNAYLRRSVDNWTMINNQDSPGATAANNATSPLKAAGYKMYWNTTDSRPNNSSDPNPDYKLNTDETVRATRLMQYLLEKSPKTYLTAITTQNDGRAAGVFWRDYISSYTKVSELPATAIPLIVDQYGNCTTFIDLKNRFFWLGESEHFGSRCAGDQQKLLDNLCDFLVKVAGYGSAFTDLLLEEGTAFDDGRKAQPAPWDEYWNDTSNGGTDNRVKPIRP